MDSRYLIPVLALSLVLLQGQAPVPPAQTSPEGIEETSAQAAIQAVQQARLEVRGRPGKSGKNVKECVAWFEGLYPKHSPKGYRSLGWSAKPSKGGHWAVTLKLVAQGTRTEAVWEYDPRTGNIGFMDHLSKHLSWVP